MNTDPNGFSEEDFKSIPHEAKERLNGLPKNSDGSFNLEAMDADQKSIYWEEKAKASTRGHHQFRQQTEREIEILKKNGVKPAENLPALDSLKAEDLGLKSDDPSLPILQRIVRIAEDNAVRRIANDPAFAGAVGGANRSRLDQAFNKLASEDGYEAVLTYKDEIISRYFTDDLAIPEDAYSVLKPIAGGVLFEHRADIDAERKPKHDQVDMLGGQGGDKNPAPARSIEYWERLAQENPAEFAKAEVQKMFNEDMAKIQA